MAAGRLPCVQRLLFFAFLSALLQSGSIACVSQAAAKATHGAGKCLSSAQVSGPGSGEAAGMAWVRNGKMLLGGVGNSPVSSKVRGESTAGTRGEILLLPWAGLQWSRDFPAALGGD